jgi:cytochrome b subunit of formate dehydrogenase
MKDMFRVLVTLIIITLSVWLYKTLQRTGNTWNLLKQELQVWKEYKGIEWTEISERLRRGSILSTLVFLLILAVSAYLHILIAGSPLSGWLLILHVTVAPLFTLSLLFTILLYAHKLRFNRQDLQSLLQIIDNRKMAVNQIRDFLFWGKIHFWLFMLMSIPAIFSILLQLFPLFDSDGMEFLIQVHRYGTLFMFCLGTSYLRLHLCRGNYSSHK